MVVFTIDYMVSGIGKPEIVEHDVVKIEGEKDKLEYTCKYPDSDCTYPIFETVTPVYLSEEQAQAELDRRNCKGEKRCCTATKPLKTTKSA